MATRSHIGMLHENGEIQYIYCHWDGYPSHNGQILLDHYQDPEKIKSLLELGSISVLAPRVAPEEGEDHSYDSQVEGVVVAYHRDRGEEIKIGVCYSERAYISKGDWVDYQYLFKEDKWYYSRGGDFVELVL